MLVPLKKRTNRPVHAPPVCAVQPIGSSVQSPDPDAFVNNIVYLYLQHTLLCLSSKMCLLCYILTPSLLAQLYNPSSFNTHNRLSWSFAFGLSSCPSAFAIHLSSSSLFSFMKSFNVIISTPSKPTSQNAVCVHFSTTLIPWGLWNYGKREGRFAVSSQNQSTTSSRKLSQ